MNKEEARLRIEKIIDEKISEFESSWSEDEDGGLVFCGSWNDFFGDFKKSILKIIDEIE